MGHAMRMHAVDAELVAVVTFVALQPQSRQQSLHGVIREKAVIIRPLEQEQPVGRRIPRVLPGLDATLGSLEQTEVLLQVRLCAEPICHSIQCLAIHSGGPVGRELLAVTGFQFDTLRLGQRVEPLLTVFAVDVQRDNITAPQADVRRGAVLAVVQGAVREPLPDRIVFEMVLVDEFTCHNRTS